MKLLVFLLIFYNFCFAQADTTITYRDTVSLTDTISLIDKLFPDTIKFNLSNNVSSSYASNTKQINFSFSGTNNINYRKIGLYNTTSLGESWVTDKIAEEVSHKTNLTYKNVFLLYMFNHSLTRGINLDNSFGIGYVHWWKYVSISYGVLNEKTIFTTLPTKNVFRHSVRFKLVLKFLSVEYYYQPNLLTFSDAIVNGIVKLTLFQNKAIGITLNDNVNYRSTSNVKMIHTSTLGLNLTLKN
jgi:hypothetical protein